MCMCMCMLHVHVHVACATCDALHMLLYRRVPNPNPNPNPNPTLQARAHVLERFREDAHGNFYNPDELAAETEELFGKSFEQARHLPPL
jgi:hypothetical protein